MKIRSVSLSLAPLAFALGLAVSPPAGQDDAGSMAMQVKELEKRVTEVEVYLQAQAKVAASTEKAMDKAEEEGFIPGMNHPAREALLNGLRDAAKAAQTKVPGAKGEGEKDGDKKGRGRRER